MQKYTSCIPTYNSKAHGTQSGNLEIRETNRVELVGEPEDCCHCRLVDDLANGGGADHLPCVQELHVVTFQYVLRFIQLKKELVPVIKFEPMYLKGLYRFSCFCCFLMSLNVSINTYILIFLQ